MLFQLHQYTKKTLQQWRQSNKFLLICYGAHLSIDVHCSTHLKNNNSFLFKPRIKIIKVLFFFFHSFILDLTVLKLSSSQALSSSSLLSDLFHQLSSLKLSSPSHVVPVVVAIPAHFLLSHLSSSHLSSSNLQATLSPSPSQPTLISLICQALISLISQALISQPTPSPSQPSSSPSHAVPAHASTRSTSGQCSLFFCSEFFNCCFGLIFLGLVLFCGLIFLPSQPTPQNICF